jgi:hypothetical protein
MPTWGNHHSLITDQGGKNFSLKNKEFFKGKFLPLRTPGLGKEMKFLLIG